MKLNTRDFPILMLILGKRAPLFSMTRRKLRFHPKSYTNYIGGMRYYSTFYITYTHLSVVFKTLQTNGKPEPWLVSKSISVKHYQLITINLNVGGFI